jgi:RNA polymerase sigma factor (TIGR02999 family)
MEIAEASGTLGSVTICLKEVNEGRPGAEDRLLSLVYDRLRHLAGHKMRRERPEHTLQPTALANEAYIRLLRAIRETPWKDRSHFYATCAMTMRNILIDYARKRRMERVDIELVPGVAFTQQRSDWLIAFDESLDRLARFDARGAQIVQLTYFTGLTHKETAELLKLSTRTVKRDLSFCLMWIRRDMGDRKSQEAAGPAAAYQ